MATHLARALPPHPLLTELQGGWLTRSPPAASGGRGSGAAMPAAAAAAPCTPLQAHRHRSSAERYLQGCTLRSSYVVSICGRMQNVRRLGPWPLANQECSILRRVVVSHQHPPRVRS